MGGVWAPRRQGRLPENGGQRSKKKTTCEAVTAEDTWLPRGAGGLCAFTPWAEGCVYLTERLLFFLVLEQYAPSRNACCVNAIFKWWRDPLGERGRLCPEDRAAFQGCVGTVGLLRALATGNYSMSRDRMQAGGT